jgi:hypothetical protein
MSLGQNIPPGRTVRPRVFWQKGQNVPEILGTDNPATTLITGISRQRNQFLRGKNAGKRWGRFECDLKTMVMVEYSLSAKKWFDLKHFQQYFEFMHQDSSSFIIFRDGVMRFLAIFCCGIFLKVHFKHRPMRVPIPMRCNHVIFHKKVSRDNWKKSLGTFADASFYMHILCYSMSSYFLAESRRSAFCSS